jgi:hypothetical protein
MYIPHYIRTIFSIISIAKNEMITLLKKLNLPKDSYVVLIGASLCARGIRNSGDIDLLIHPSLRKILLKNGFKEEVISGQNNVCRRFSQGKIEAFDYFLNVGFFEEFTRVFSPVEYIEGIPFVSISDIQGIKHRFNREKDKKDLILLEQYQKQLHVAQLSRVLA